MANPELKGRLGRLVVAFPAGTKDLKARTAGALAYPIFLAVAGVSIVTVLLVYFVPKFAVLFDRLRARGELPVVTDWLLWFSGSLRSWGWMVILALVILALLLRARLATESGRRMWDRIRLRFPGAGPIFRNLAVSRFCRVLGTLLRNGVPILKSLDIAGAPIGDEGLAHLAALPRLRTLYADKTQINGPGLVDLRPEA